MKWRKLLYVQRYCANIYKVMLPLEEMEIFVTRKRGDYCNRLMDECAQIHLYRKVNLQSFPSLIFRLY